MSLSLGKIKVSNFNIASLCCNDPALAFKTPLAALFRGRVPKSLDVRLTALKAKGILCSRFETAPLSALGFKISPGVKLFFFLN